MTFRTKIGEGLGYGGTPTNWDPYLFLQPLKLATSNLVHKLGLELPYQKTTVKTKIGEAWARRASGKKWNPLFISATVEKLVHNMSSGLPCQTQVLGPD